MTNMNKKPNGHWKIKENCLAEARKYSTPLEWQRKSPGSLCASYKYGWTAECSAHMDTRKNTLLRERIEEKNREIVEVKEELNLHQRIQAERRVMNFLGLGKKQLFFQDNA